MGRGVSCGGGQSSLDYLFGNPEPHKLGPNKQVKKATPASTKKPKEIPAGIHGDAGNNYFRADGQYTGNFITDWPSTKVHAALGGGSSLGYLFGSGGKRE